MPINVTEDGVAVDLSGVGVTVQLRWSRPDGTVTLETLTAVSAALGQFKKVWVAGDTDLVGVHRGQVVATTAGNPVTYPSDGSALIWFVHKQLGD